VEEICDHIILVNRGQKILDGTVHQVKQDFKEYLYRISLTGTGNDITDNEVFVIKDRSDNSLIIQKQEGKSNNEILQYLLSNGASIESFNEILPSLNDIFIRQVEGTPLARRFQEVH
jgi:ABC-2 type transport system ATP-binding protein